MRVLVAERPTLRTLGNVPGSLTPTLNAQDDVEKAAGGARTLGEVCTECLAGGVESKVYVQAYLLRI